MRRSLLLLTIAALATAGCAATGGGGADEGRTPVAPWSAGSEPAGPDAVRTPSPSAPDATPTPSPTPTQSPTPTPSATLPGGGTTILPDHRLVGFAGGRSPAFGRLSVDGLDAAAAQIDAIAAEYDGDGRTILPVFELITVIAHGSPAADGLYRTHEPDEVIAAYLAAARRHGALLLLNVQPGRADFLAEVTRLEPWLREPDVGLALDPEWAVGPNEVPGDVYGSTTGAELDSVAAYLSALVAEHGLPEKVMVFHQVHSSVVEDEAALLPHPGVVTIKSVDGIGSRADKERTWTTLMSTKPPHVAPGFKLFFEEDVAQGPLMTPAEVLGLAPTPDYVLYE
ncbi:hypothetical protein E1262_03320 [Jiangella aurantiaca]|uniref:Lipoprotein n=1 Tax=Jiangella aurantiaca TaxID=2530373 RepID=A0A4R5ALG9_9ACTN|nr:hypothetical protein [Jiangella aurantiaca]TDD72349.1 hypothetical protein E1262_03320 [Jiangella aurantiaca]